MSLIFLTYFNLLCISQELYLKPNIVFSNNWLLQSFIRFCFLCFLYGVLDFFPSILVPDLPVWLTVYVSFSDPLQLQSWVLLVKDLFCNRKYCGCTCIVVFEGQLKYDCSAETEKQRTWRKYFHIWKTELFCPSVLKSKSAYIKCLAVHFPPNAFTVCFSHLDAVCVLFSVGLQTLFPDIYDLWPFNFCLTKFLS